MLSPILDHTYIFRQGHVEVKVLFFECLMLYVMRKETCHLRKEECHFQFFVESVKIHKS